jgi:DnaD and phage-associated domain
MLDEVVLVFKTLLQQQLIDVEGLLLLNYKKIGLDENQAMTMLLIMRLEKMQVPYITIQVLADYMSLDDKLLDRYVVGLLSKKMLSLEGNSLSAKPFLQVLGQLFTKQKEVEPKPKSVNLVASFEHEFARALTPIEIETLREWKQCHYSDEMILNALKEATLSNVHNMRYIEKILIDWAKHGVKKSGREKVDLKQEKISLVDYPWWEE